eukprot:4101739-Prymnesium_polylepis.1
MCIRDRNARAVCGRTRGQQRDAGSLTARRGGGHLKHFARTQYKRDACHTLAWPMADGGARG